VGGEEEELLFRIREELCGWNGLLHFELFVVGKEKVISTWGEGAPHQAPATEADIFQGSLPPPLFFLFLLFLLSHCGFASVLVGLVLILDR